MIRPSLFCPFRRVNVGIIVILRTANVASAFEVALRVAMCTGEQRARLRPEFRVPGAIARLASGYVRIIPSPILAGLPIAVLDREQIVKGQLPVSQVEVRVIVGVGTIRVVAGCSVYCCVAGVIAIFESSQVRGGLSVVFGRSLEQARVGIITRRFFHSLNLYAVKVGPDVRFRAANVELFCRPLRQIPVQ